MWALPLSADPVAGGPPQFADATAEAGLEPRNWFGDDDTKTILETTGTGVALFDYDGDGYLDAYLVNGKSGFEIPRLRDLEHDAGSPPDGGTPRSALFRNRRDGTFEEVTDGAGVGRQGWGQGCVVGDYDNDGDLDMYLSYFGANALYRNGGDGTFAEVTAQAEVECDLYSTACAFGDVDADGWPDLFVGNYVAFDPETTPLPGQGRWGLTRGIPTSQPPEAFSGQPDFLFRNRGDGTFADVTRSAGLNPRPGKALGAVFWDSDVDGDVDLYVANDAMANFHYINSGAGAFREDALMLGTAYGAGGVAEGSMGVAVADYDGDGLPDLAVANYEGQTATLYHNEDGFFADVSFPAGIGLPTLNPLQWGVVFVDYDNDGDEDLFFANGHITAALEASYPESQYRRLNQLFRNDGGRYTDISNQAGQGLQVRKSSRGLAAGDYDNDGDRDLLVVNKNDIPTLLRNDGGSRAGHWLRVRATGDRGNRDGIGARVRVVSSGHRQTKEARSGSSYLSQSSPWVWFGLGPATRVDTVEVRWPGGAIRSAFGVAADQGIVMHEENGLAE